MTGPEHYREAERLLTPVLGPTGGGHYLPTDSDVATAQVHATLALAAATVANDATQGLTTADWQDWQNVLGGAS